MWSQLSPTQFIYRSHSSLLLPFGWTTVVCNRWIRPIPIKSLHGHMRTHIRVNLWFGSKFPTVTSQGRETYDVGTSTMCSWQASLELTGAISHKFSHVRWADLWSDWSVWWRGVILIFWYWYPYIVFDQIDQFGGVHCWSDVWRSHLDIWLNYGGWIHPLLFLAVPEKHLWTYEGLSGSRFSENECKTSCTTGAQI